MRYAIVAVAAAFMTCGLAGNAQPVQAKDGKYASKRFNYSVTFPPGTYVSEYPVEGEGSSFLRGTTLGSHGDGGLYTIFSVVISEPKPGSLGEDFALSGGKRVVDTLTKGGWKASEPKTVKVGKAKVAGTETVLTKGDRATKVLSAVDYPIGHVIALDGPAEHVLGKEAAAAFESFDYTRPKGAKDMDTKGKSK